MTWGEWLTHAYQSHSALEVAFGVVFGLPVSILAGCFALVAGLAIVLTPWIWLFQLVKFFWALAFPPKPVVRQNLPDKEPEPLPEPLPEPEPEKVPSRFELV